MYPNNYEMEKLGGLTMTKPKIVKTTTEGYEISSLTEHREVNLIRLSCWQSKTSQVF